VEKQQPPAPPDKKPAAKGGNKWLEGFSGMDERLKWLRGFGDRAAAELNKINAAATSAGAALRTAFDGADFEGGLVAALTRMGMAVSDWFDSNSLGDEGHQWVYTFGEGMKAEAGPIEAWFLGWLGGLKSAVASFISDFKAAWDNIDLSAKLEFDPTEARANVNRVKSSLENSGNNRFGGSATNVNDSRNQSISTEVNINQTVTTPTSAPAAAAQATGNAVSRAVQEQSRVVAEPAYP
jgi:hypothetical protein